MVPNTELIDIPISNRGETLDLSDVSDVSTPLPTWLTAHDPTQCPTKLPRFPRTKEHFELQELTFSAIFERVLDELVTGKTLKQVVREDPRDVDEGAFRRWIHKDKDRLRQLREADKIGADAVMDIMEEIAAGTESLEDIERSKLRLAQLKFRAQVNNRERYGNDKEIAQPFGAGGITITIGAVKPVDEKVIEHSPSLITP